MKLTSFKMTQVDIKTCWKRRHGNLHTLVAKKDHTISSIKIYQLFPKKKNDLPLTLVETKLQGWWTNLRPVEAFVELYRPNDLMNLPSLNDQSPAANTCGPAVFAHRFPKPTNATVVLSIYSANHFVKTSLGSSYSFWWITVVKENNEITQNHG